MRCFKATIEIIGINPYYLCLTPMHPKLENATNTDAKAKEIFSKLSPSHQKEIKRYINNLKSEQSIERNVTKAIASLHGKERFIGRERP